MGRHPLPNHPSQVVHLATRKLYIDIAEIREILCPPKPDGSSGSGSTGGLARQTPHRKSSQKKTAFSRLLKKDDDGPGALQPGTVIGSDGRRHTLDQPVSVDILSAITVTEERGPHRRLSYGTPITINCVGQQNMRDVLPKHSKHSRRSGTRTVTAASGANTPRAQGESISQQTKG